MDMQGLLYVNMGYLVLRLCVFLYQVFQQYVNSG